MNGCHFKLATSQRVLPCGNNAHHANGHQKHLIIFYNVPILKDMGCGRTFRMIYTKYVLSTIYCNHSKNTYLRGTNKAETTYDPFQIIS